MTAVEEFWQRCRVQLPWLASDSRYFLRRIGNTEQLSDTLFGLITAGEKIGAFSRLAEYVPPSSVPPVGALVILADHAGAPRCLVEIEATRTLPLRDIGAAETACESARARDPAVWRDIHRRYWTPTLAAQGVAFTDDLPVVFQRFRLLYAEPR